MVFSIVSSFVLWCVVSLFFSFAGEDDQYSCILDVPITVDLPESFKSEGLRIFNNEDSNVARVFVKGNRLVIGRLTKNDVQVICDQITVTSPGIYEVQLSVKKITELRKFSVVSINPPTAKVMIDRYREQQFDIQDGIKYNASSQYFASKTKFSPQNVIVSGPESIVSKIDRVVGTGEIGGILSEGVTFDSKLLLYGYNNEEIDSKFLTVSVRQSQATIPILYKKIIPIGLMFKNIPKNADFVKNRIKIIPPEVEVAGPKKILESLSEVKLAPLDFSKIALGLNEFTLPLDLPVDCRNISDNAEIKIYINTEGLFKKFMTLKRFETMNIPKDKEVSVKTSYINVEIMGPKDSVEKLKDDDLLAKLDFKEKGDTTGQTEISVQIEVTTSGDCWALGDYSTRVNIFKK
jgi:YbbR domain-containing protein